MIERKTLQERLLQADFEEEKEVPSEHPDEQLNTPTRNGCSMTTFKGLSFERGPVAAPKQMQAGVTDEFQLKNLAKRPE